MFVNLPLLSNFLVEYMARPIRKKSGTGIYQVLRYALSFGAGVRQFSRLTGVSFGVIQKLKNDHQNRPRDSIIGGVMGGVLGSWSTSSVTEYGVSKYYQR